MNDLTDIMDQHKKEIVGFIDGVRKESYLQGKKDAIEEYKQTDEYIRECVQRYLKGKADGKAEAIDECIKIFRSIPRHYYRDELLNELEQLKEKNNGR